MSNAFQCLIVNFNQRGHLSPPAWSYRSMFAESNEKEALENEKAPLEEVAVFGRFLQSEAVRALRTPTPIIDVPQSLSIVTSEQIEQRGYASVADMISYISVSMSQGEGHRDAVVFRGVRSTADFFIDGIRDDSQYYRSFYNLDQVEILRGPNALLFGRGGAGGVLNRVTKNHFAAGWAF